MHESIYDTVSLVFWLLSPRILSINPLQVHAGNWTEQNVLNHLLNHSSDRSSCSATLGHTSLDLVSCYKWIGDLNFNSSLLIFEWIYKSSSRSATQIWQPAFPVMMCSQPSLTFPGCEHLLTFQNMATNTAATASTWPKAKDMPGAMNIIAADCK